ncbi:uncharacterized protein [Ptychodera flava]|uniref:uncharacterized protein isoform X2 n=1 Tax=Ptychodera flava TaxID=63121 RepID=UPI00396A9C2F
MANAKLSSVRVICCTLLVIAVGKQNAQGFGGGKAGEDGKEDLPGFHSMDQGDAAFSTEHRILNIPFTVRDIISAENVRPTAVPQADKFQDKKKEDVHYQSTMSVQRDRVSRTAIPSQTLTIKDLKKSKPIVLMSNEIFPTPTARWKQPGLDNDDKDDTIATGVMETSELDDNFEQNTVRLHNGDVLKTAKGMKNTVVNFRHETSKSVTRRQESQVPLNSLFGKSIVASEVFSSLVIHDVKSIPIKDIARTQLISTAQLASTITANGKKQEVSAEQGNSLHIPLQSRNVKELKETQKVIEIYPTPVVTSSLTRSEIMEVTRRVVKTDEKSIGSPFQDATMLSQSMPPVKELKHTTVRQNIQPSKDLKYQSSVLGDIITQESNMQTWAATSSIQEIKPIPTPSITFDPKENKFMPSSTLEILASPDGTESLSRMVNLKTITGDKFITAGKEVISSSVSMERGRKTTVAMETASESFPRMTWKGSEDVKDIMRTHQAAKSEEIRNSQKLIAQTTHDEVLSQAISPTFSIPVVMRTKKTKEDEFSKIVPVFSTVPLNSVDKLTRVLPSSSIQNARSFSDKLPEKSKQLLKSAVTQEFTSPVNEVVTLSAQVEKSVAGGKKSTQQPHITASSSLDHMQSHMTSDNQWLTVGPTSSQSERSSMKSAEVSKSHTIEPSDIVFSTQDIISSTQGITISHFSVSNPTTTSSLHSNTAMTTSVTSSAPVTERIEVKPPPNRPPTKPSPTKPPPKKVPRKPTTEISLTTGNRQHTSSRKPEESTIPTTPSYPEVYIELVMEMTWTEFCPMRKDFKTNLAMIAKNVSVIKATSFGVVLLNDYRNCNREKSNQKFLERRSSEVYIDLYYAIKNKYSKTLTVQAGYAIETNHQHLGAYADKLLKVSISGEASTSQPTYGDKPPHFMGWTIGVVVAGVLLMVFFVSGTYKMRKRRLKKKQMEVFYGSCGECLVINNTSYDKETVHLTSFSQQTSHSKLSKKNSKSIVAAVNYAMEWDEVAPQVFPSHVLTVENLSKFYMYTEAIDEEFQSLPNPTVKACEIPSGIDHKNRFSHVLPPLKSRVQLTYRMEDETSEYINANFVKGYNDQRKEYIATQAPMENTVVDFWRMIWEQQSRVILMITDINKKRCYQYWPVRPDGEHSTQLHGDYLISVQARHIKEYCTVTTLLIKDIEVSECLG